MHDAFQAWRQAHPDGFHMTEKSRGEFVIHWTQDKRGNAQGHRCHHQGGSCSGAKGVVHDWERNFRIINLDETEVLPTIFRPGRPLCSRFIVVERNKEPEVSESSTNESLVNRIIREDLDLRRAFKEKPAKILTLVLILCAAAGLWIWIPRFLQSTPPSSPTGDTNISFGGTIVVTKEKTGDVVIIEQSK